MKQFRKIVCLSLLFLLMHMGTVALAYESYEQLHVTNCEQWVSLRKNPSTSSKCIMQLPKDALVRFIAESGDFLQVSYSGTMGFVGRKYLRGAGESDCVTMYVANCKEWASLWEEENTTSARLDKIPLGAEVLSHGRRDDVGTMALVVYNYRFGYVLPEYLSLLPPEENETVLVSAAIHVPDQNGNDFVQTIKDAYFLSILEEMLRAAAPSISGQCPYQAQLVLTLRDGSVLKLMYPTDGCTAFFTTDGSVYAFPKAGADQFWMIFDEAASKLK